MVKVKFTKDCKLAHDGIKIMEHKKGDVAEISQITANTVLVNELGELVGDKIKVEAPKVEKKLKKVKVEDAIKEMKKKKKKPTLAEKAKKALSQGAPENK